MMIEKKHNEDVDLNKVLSLCWNQKILILSITLFISICSIIYALSLPDIYTSKVVLAPASQENSLSSRLGGLSALGSMAGLSLPSDSSSKSQEAIQRIQSFEFFSTYFLPNIKLENIMSVKKWIPEKNLLVYDEDEFDINSNNWVRDITYPKQIKPSPQEAFKTYEEIISVYEDKKTSFVTISIDHKSPIIAKEWLDIIIYQINESMRKIDAEIAQNSVNYLNEVSKSTNFKSLKEAIVKLLEDQMQTIMLTASSEAYVFKVIDSPIVSEERSKPKRVLMVILATILGCFFSLAVIFIKYYRQPYTS
jgi:LPS O-antigen subunit length determinant protein (WzzB/FepE family)